MSEFWIVLCSAATKTLLWGTLEPKKTVGDAAKTRRKWGEKGANRHREMLPIKTGGKGTKAAWKRPKTGRKRPKTAQKRYKAVKRAPKSCKFGRFSVKGWKFSRFPSEVARAQGQCLNVVLKMGVSAAFWGHPSPFWGWFPQIGAWPAPWCFWGRFHRFPPSFLRAFGNPLARSLLRSSSPSLGGIWGGCFEKLPHGASIHRVVCLFSSKFKHFQQICVPIIPEQVFPHPRGCSRCQQAPRNAPKNGGCQLLPSPPQNHPKPPGFHPKNQVEERELPFSTRFGRITSAAVLVPRF